MFLVYKAYIQLQITYAAEAGAFIFKQNLLHLQAIQNMALCLIGDYDWDTTNVQIHKDNYIPTLQTYIKQQTQNFYRQFRQNQNRLITQLDQCVPKHTHTYSCQKSYFHKATYVA